MSRQAYMTRFGLGRSPFQPANTQNGSPDPVVEAARFEPGQSSHVPEHRHQYDEKGRPVNRTTNERNARMRRAQNSVLKLVGVVEDKEHSGRENELRIRVKREARLQTLKREDDRGEVIELLLVISRPLLTWWLDCFMRRVEVGLHDPRFSLGSIMRQEWRLVTHGGLRNTIMALFPGALAYGMYIMGRMSAASAMDGVTNVVANIVWKRSISLPRSNQIFVDDLLQYSLGAARLALDVALLPLLYFSTAQQIGIAPASPLLPPIGALLPGTSLCSAAWTPCWNLPVIGSFCTPAALLLSSTYLQGDVDEGTPIAKEFTDFSYPTIDSGDYGARKPAFRHDPLGWVLYEGYRIRAGFMRWCGWNTMRDFSSAPFEEHLAVKDSHPNGVHHRSTHLAQLTAKYLSWRLDELFVMALAMPFESVMLNFVATTYNSSSLPLTRSGFDAAQRRPWANLDTIGSLGPAGIAIQPGTLSAHLTRLGLTLGLRIAFECIAFAGVYRLVRCQGVGNFGWAARDRGRSS